MELMANSDNVLRGGLTAKTIDVPELLKILDFTHNEVDILKPERRESGEEIYHTPAKEFLLSVISVVKGSLFESTQERSVEIMTCLEGDARVTDLGTGDALSLTKGTAIIVQGTQDELGPITFQQHEALTIGIDHGLEYSIRHRIATQGF